MQHFTGHGEAPNPVGGRRRRAAAAGSVAAWLVIALVQPPPPFPLHSQLQTHHPLQTVEELRLHAHMQLPEDVSQQWLHMQVHEMVEAMCNKRHVMLPWVGTL